MWGRPLGSTRRSATATCGFFPVMDIWWHSSFGTMCSTHSACRAAPRQDWVVVYPSAAMNHDLARSARAAWAATISKQNG